MRGEGQPKQKKYPKKKLKQGGFSPAAGTERELIDLSE